MLRRACLVAAVALGLVLAVPGTASAVCKITGVTAKTPKKYSVNKPPYEYRAEGHAYVANPGAKSGCVMQVCLAEELGKGNWVHGSCTWNQIGGGVKNYYSYAPWFDCQTYGGTGYVRTSARMEGSSVRILGPPRFIC
jgi:hypothetical protein